MLSLFRQQPPALSMIFMLEVWERFGFYTVQGILTLYFIRRLGFSDENAYYSFGAFYAIIYGLVALGGYLGDKVLGPKRTLLLGLCVLALGYFSLAIAGSSLVFYALGLICVGNGLFKSNPSNILSRCYEKDDPRLQSGFTLYYMAVNLGSIFALLIGPYLSSHYGYFYAYMTSGFGIVLGLFNYGLRYKVIRFIETAAEKRKVCFWQWLLIVLLILCLTICAAFLLQHTRLAKWVVWFITLVAITVYCRMMQCEGKVARRRMLLVLWLMLEAIIFFTLYQQMPTSINLFSINNVRPLLFGLSIDPQSFQVLNPLWIIVLSPLLAKLYLKLQQGKQTFTIPYKFAVGLAFCGLSFMILFITRFYHDTAGMVSSGWLIFSYCFQALSELLISALGLAMVAELVPDRMVGFVMGIWFLNSSVTGFTGAMVASRMALPKQILPGIDSLMIYTHVFGEIGCITWVFSVILWMIAPMLNKMMITNPGPS